MRRFDVAAKTIARDVQVLQEFYHIRKERKGRAIFYQLEKGV